MMSEGPLPLPAVDRVVMRAHDAVAEVLASFGSEEDRAALRRRDPFANVRDVAGQTMYRSLKERSYPDGPDAQHRDALLRWVHELLQTRVGWELIVDEVDALHERDRALNPRASAEIPATYADAYGAVLSATHERPMTAAYERLGELAPPVSAVRNEMRARRLEVAQRLGLEHYWSLATSDLRKLESLALAILEATEPLASELAKDLRRRTRLAASPPTTVLDAFAHGAEEGWPARLNARWFEDVFRAIAPRAPRNVAMPRALGGASFLLAADAWGRALRLAGTARSLPFSMARDPYATEPAVLGAVLASAVAGPVFARRKLGLTERAIDVHARSLGRALLVSVRTSAAKVVLGISPSPDAIAELGARVFGAPLSKELGHCWAYGGWAGISRRLDVVTGTPARLLGAVRAAALAKNLVDRFDEDWFDNPRAGAHLSAIGAGPVWYGDVPESTEATPIARAFEELLG